MGGREVPKGQSGLRPGWDVGRGVGQAETAERRRAREHRYSGRMDPLGLECTRRGRQSGRGLAQILEVMESKELGFVAGRTMGSP